MRSLADRPVDPVVGLPVPHESAGAHVTGTALYTDDLVARGGAVLHAWPVQAPHAHARMRSLRTDPALEVPGVERVLTAQDVPGVNDAGSKQDEPLFPEEVMFHGQAVAWVLGESLEAARRGAAAVEVDYEPLPSLITLPEAIAAGSFQGARPTVRRGDAAAALGRPCTGSPGSSRSAGRSTSTWRPTPPWPASTRPDRSSCSPAPSTPRRPRRSWPTFWVCAATR